MYHIPMTVKHPPPLVHIIPQKNNNKKHFECVCAPPLKEKIKARHIVQ